jgi:hypothetical protein
MKNIEELGFEISTMSVFNNGDIVHLQRKAVHLACQKRENSIQHKDNVIYMHILKFCNH